MSARLTAVTWKRGDAMLGVCVERSSLDEQLQMLIHEYRTRPMEAEPESSSFDIFQGIADAITDRISNTNVNI